jgi:hypothetical protein
MLSLVAVLLGLAHGAVDAAIEWLFPHDDPVRPDRQGVRDRSGAQPWQARPRRTPAAMTVWEKAGIIAAMVIGALHALALVLREGRAHQRAA